MKATLLPVLLSPLAAAVEMNLFDFFRTMRFWPEPEVHDGPDSLWTLTEIPFPPFNVLLRAGFAARTAQADIEAAIGRCDSRGVPMLWFTGPSAHPYDLSSRLGARGLSNQPQLGMAVDVLTMQSESSASIGFGVERVADTEGLRTCCYVACAAFGYRRFVEDAYVRWFTRVGLESGSPLRHYICHRGAETVGACSLLLDGEIAGLYFVGILPGARRQGIGSTLVSALLREARAAGARACVLFAIPTIAGFYRRLGYQRVCSMTSHVWTSRR
jgi:ribosomal protein S18 acetylase RimI-like enzyme